MYAHPEVTIDANGHCELPAGMRIVPEEAFYHWDGYIRNWDDSHHALGLHNRMGCKDLKSISIPASVTKIGNYAFALCSSLEVINIPASVTTIEEFAFYECCALQHVTIPSTTTISPNAFGHLTRVCRGRGP